MKFILVLSFTGLIAFVPDYDNKTMTVLLVDTCQEPKCKEAPRVPHVPTLSLPLRNLSRESRCGIKEKWIFADEEGDQIVRYKLHRVVIKLGDRGEDKGGVRYRKRWPANKKRPFFPWRHSNFQWTVHMDHFHPNGYRANPECLKEPLCREAAASLKLDHGLLRSAHLGRSKSGRLILWEFVPQMTPQPQYTPQPHYQVLSDKVELRIPDLTEEITITVSDVMKSSKRKWVLRPQTPGDVVEVGLSNLPASPSSKDGNVLNHFAWFYNLVKGNVEPCHCLVPRAKAEVGQKGKKESVEAAGDPFCPGLQMSP